MHHPVKPVCCNKVVETLSASGCCKLWTFVVWQELGTSVCLAFMPPCISLLSSTPSLIERTFKLQGLLTGKSSHSPCSNITLPVLHISLSAPKCPDSEHPGAGELLSQLFKGSWGQVIQDCGLKMSVLALWLARLAVYSRADKYLVILNWAGHVIPLLSKYRSRIFIEHFCLLFMMINNFTVCIQHGLSVSVLKIHWLLALKTTDFSLMLLPSLTSLLHLTVSFYCIFPQSVVYYFISNWCLHWWTKAGF